MTRNSEKSGFSWRKIFLFFLSLITIWWACSHQADAVAHRSVSLAFPNWDIYYGSIWLRPGGGAWISDVDMVPLNGDEEDIYHFDKVAVEIPFFQFYRSAWDWDLLDRMPRIKDVTLHLEGGSGPMQWPFSREMALFGNASASPFEANGCAEDGSFTADEFPAMGLEAKPTRLTMAWHRQTDRIIKEQSIETPGVSRVDYRGELLVHDQLPLLSSLGSADDELSMAEWHVVDDGFVAARNAYCAKKDGVSPSEFIERHLSTSQRTLAAVGMQARESTLSSYRHFVEQGGNLDLVVNYSPTIDGSVRNDDDWSRWLARTQGQLSVAGRSTALSVRTIVERPFPETDQYTSVWQILSAEQAAQVVASATATSNETEAPPAVIAALAKRDKEPPEVALKAPSEQEILYAETEVVEERPDLIEDYAKLRHEVGQRFMLYVKGKPRVRVEIVGIENGVIKIRRYLRSGWLEQGVKQASFVRAERVR